MNSWVINNSLQKQIFIVELSIIESWNDVLFLYSKICTDPAVYKNNYLFFGSSTNSPFSKSELLVCLETAFETLDMDDFSKSLTKEDKRLYYELFLEIKNAVMKDPGLTFSTSII